MSEQGAIAYEIDTSQIEAQLKHLEKFNQIVDPILARAMQTSVIMIVGEVRPLTPVGVNAQLRRSIGSTVIREGPLSIVGKVGSTMTEEVYPAVMEFGRKAGSKMPPPDALERWVHIKLGVPADEAPGVAWRVARSIGRRGIAGRFFMKTGWERSKSRVIAAFNRALAEIAEALVRR